MKLFKHTVEDFSCIVMWVLSHDSDFNSTLLPCHFSKKNQTHTVRDTKYISIMGNDRTHWDI